MRKDDMTDINVTPQQLFDRLMDAYQHSVTQEQLAKTEDNLNNKIDKVETRLNEKIDKLELGLNNRIDKVESSLNAKIDNVESSLNTKIDKVESNLNAKFNKLDNKQDRLSWFIIAGFLGLIFKDQIITLLS